MRKSRLRISRSQAEALANKLAEPVARAVLKHGGLVFSEFKIVWPFALRETKKAILEVMEKENHVISDKKREGR